MRCDNAELFEDFFLLVLLGSPSVAATTCAEIASNPRRTRMQIKKNGIPTTMKAISRGHNIETCGPGATEHTPGITAVGGFLVIGACMTALATSGRVFSIAPSRQDIITSNGHNGQVHPYVK